ncbi:hypothetical protein AGE78_01350 (plasmid) [Klebsiella pneumoniae]|nr:hypothetical protein AGE78_01350 [Klebsiella pneumoniae]
MFHTIVSIKNDGHYFCRAGGNRPDGLNEPVTIIMKESIHNVFFGHVDLTINLYCLRILFPGHLQGACRAVS